MTLIKGARAIGESLEINIKRDVSDTHLREPKENDSEANDEGEHETKCFNQKVSNHVFSTPSRLIVQPGNLSQDRCQ